MHRAALVLRLSLYCEKLRTEWNTLIHIIWSGIASGYELVASFKIQRHWDSLCNGDHIQDHEVIVSGVIQTERAQSQTHYDNMWLSLFFKAKLTFSHNSNLLSETLRALIPPYLHHQSEIWALEEMGTKRTYMSRGVWLRSGLAPCCCAWGCWEMMRDDLWSLEITLWRESRGWEIVLQ